MVILKFCYMEKSVRNSLPESHMYLEQQGWVNDKLNFL